MSLTRSLLAKAIANPRLRQEFEGISDSIDTAQQQLTDLVSSATDLQTRLQALIDAGSQPHSDVLDQIANSPDDQVGVFEKVGVDQLQLREVDSSDDACLVPRYKLISFVGSGPSSSRPALSSQRRALYFDTTLAGKPIFWNGSAWVDSTGTAV